MTDDVKQRFKDFALACRVKVALATAAETRALDLDVQAREGVVEVSGTAPLLPAKRPEDHIAQIARATEGVQDVRLKLQWFDPHY